MEGVTDRWGKDVIDQIEVDVLQLLEGIHVLLADSGLAEAEGRIVKIGVPDILKMTGSATALHVVAQRLQAKLLKIYIHSIELWDDPEFDEVCDE